MGHLQWRKSSDGTLNLYLKEPGDIAWKPYKASRWSVPDTAGLPPGTRTWQHLLAQGWQALTVDGKPL